MISARNLSRGTIVRAVRDATPVKGTGSAPLRTVPLIPEGSCGFIAGRPFPESIPTAVCVGFETGFADVRLADLEVVAGD